MDYSKISQEASIPLPQREGCEAFLNGFGKLANPYPMFSTPYEQWKTGWEETLHSKEYLDGIFSEN